MEPAQEQLLRDLADLVGPRIGMDKIPCFGFWLQAVRHWQQRHKVPVVALGRLSPPERAKAAREIREHFGALVEDQLPESRGGEVLRSALDDAWSLYLDRYNHR